MFNHTSTCPGKSGGKTDFDSGCLLKQLLLEKRVGKGADIVKKFAAVLPLNIGGCR